MHWCIPDIEDSNLPPTCHMEEASWTNKNAAMYVCNGIGRIRADSEIDVDSCIASCCI